MKTKYTITYNNESSCYEGDGFVMKREFDTLSKHGNKMNGRWVLRKSDNKIVDYDMYRSDLAEAWGIELIGGEYENQYSMGLCRE